MLADIVISASFDDNTTVTYYWKMENKSLKRNSNGRRWSVQKDCLSNWTSVEKLIFHLCTWWYLQQMFTLVMHLFRVCQQKSVMFLTIWFITQLSVNIIEQSSQWSFVLLVKIVNRCKRPATDTVQKHKCL